MCTRTYLGCLGTVAARARRRRCHALADLLAPRAPSSQQPRSRQTRPRGHRFRRPAHAREKVHQTKSACGRHTHFFGPATHAHARMPTVAPAPCAREVRRAHAHADSRRSRGDQTTASCRPRRENQPCLHATSQATTNKAARAEERRPTATRCRKLPALHNNRTWHIQLCRRRSHAQTPNRAAATRQPSAKPL